MILKNQKNRISRLDNKKLDDTKRIQHNEVSVRAWVWHCSTECVCVQSTVPDHILQYLSTAEFTQGEEDLEFKPSQGASKNCSQAGCGPQIDLSLYFMNT